MNNNTEEEKITIEITKQQARDFVNGRTGGKLL